MKALLVFPVVFLFSMLLIRPTETEKKPESFSDNSKYRVVSMNDTLHPPIFSVRERKTHLKRSRKRSPRLSAREHARYTQFYKGIPIFSGQIISHSLKGEDSTAQENYFRVKNVSIKKRRISRKEAVVAFRNYLDNDSMKEVDTPQKNKDGLVIFPIDVEEGIYRVAYMVSLMQSKRFCTTGLVDADSGKVLMTYSNVNINGTYWECGLGRHYNSSRL